MPHRRIAVLLLMLTVIVPAVAGSDAAGPALTVQVTYGPGGGPERFRADFSEALLRDLRSRGCFPAVVADGEGSGLLFRVSLEAPLEEERNELSLAGSLRNEEEMGNSRATSTIRIYADMEIVLPGSGELFRGKRIRGQASYRPTFAWEDGSAEVRDELIRGFAAQVAGYACKSNGKKLRKRLAASSSEVSPVR